MLNDIYCGKTRLENCSVEMVYKLSKSLGVSMKYLTESATSSSQIENSYELGLP